MDSGKLPPEIAHLFGLQVGMQEKEDYESQFKRIGCFGNDRKEIPVIVLQARVHSFCSRVLVLNLNLQLVLYPQNY